MKKIVFLLFLIALISPLMAQPLQEKWNIYFSLPHNAATYSLREIKFDKQPESYLEAGKAYWFGTKVKKNYRKAIRYFKKAAQADLREAKLFLALSVLHDEKPHAAQEIKQAFEELTQLARTDYPLAQYALAQAYALGKGTDINRTESLVWLQRAATAPVPIPQAQNRLAVYYYEGLPPDIEQNKQKALALFTSAALTEEPYACYNLARMYEHGDVADKNEKRAFRLMRLAAKQNILEAQLALSDFYRDGIGIQPNAYGSFHWTLQAAKQKYVPAQEQTALNYLQGNGVAVNHTEALSWAEKAKQNGSKNASNIIRQAKEGL